MKTKMIKDPVHGYIKVDNDYVKNIIDTSIFQRLRNIRQTSYDCLYPGSSHNRFIHSLGVYSLGVKAVNALERNCSSKEWCSTNKHIDWEILKRTFELACLLHDVGHTPFSHSGEDFLLLNKEIDDLKMMKKRKNQEEPTYAFTLYNDLLKTIKRYLSDEEYNIFFIDFAETVKGSIEYISGKKVPSPHEIMSAIIAVDEFSEYFKNKNVDFDLFVRAILGIRYKDSSKITYGLRNALIQLLNSSIIDVDRLDYIIRDMQMTGFYSTSIDIERLLESVTLIFDVQKNQYHFGYEKKALSTLVNVVVAHDAERRWIQGHPITMYDSFLVKKCIDAVEKQFREKQSKNSIFQKKALTSKGIRLKNDLIVRLMNDGDFLFLMKQIGDDVSRPYYITEYLYRDKRKSPIWKSEAEFRLLLKELNIKQQKIFMDIFTAESGKVDESSIGSVLNDDRINEIKNEIKRINNDKAFDEEDKKNKILVLNRQLFWLEKLKSYCKNHNMEFGIHNQKANIFQSKINELSDAGVEIWHEQFQKSEDIKEVLSLYYTENTNNKIQLFYLYINKSQDFMMKDFIDFLKEVLNEYEVYFK